MAQGSPIHNRLCEMDRFPKPKPLQVPRRPYSAEKNCVRCDSMEKRVRRRRLQTYIPHYFHCSLIDNVRTRHLRRASMSGDDKGLNAVLREKQSGRCSGRSCADDEHISVYDATLCYQVVSLVFMYVIMHFAGTALPASALHNLIGKSAQAPARVNRRASR